MPFEYQDDFLEKLKKQIFTFSFCKAKSHNNNIGGDNANNKVMWDEYGKNGLGVAIKFKITNHPDKWFAYHMSKIKYGDEELVRMCKLRKWNIKNLN